MIDTSSASAGTEGSGASGRRLPRVLFVNDLWGYGTVTMALAVADELEGRASRLFAGSGPGFDLARRASFDDLLPADTMAEEVPPELEEALDAADAVVSVMNEPVAWQATALEKPCVYLDCLAWMWDEAPDVPPGVRYYAESFPGVDQRLSQWRGQLDVEIVGPLVRRPVRPPRPDARGVALVNFGGLSCPLLDQRTAVAYAESMLTCVLSALRSWPGRIVVAIGSHVLDGMDQQTIRSYRPDVEMADLSHKAFLGELRRSRLLITSAGMHALYEASALGVPYMCLPAQNQSGALAMAVLDRRGIDRALDWTHLYGAAGLLGVDQTDACRGIADWIHRFRDDAATQARLAGHLRQALDSGYRDRIRNQQLTFFREQGEYGGRRIADRILELVTTRAAVVAT